MTGNSMRVRVSYQKFNLDILSSGIYSLDNMPDSAGKFDSPDSLGITTIVAHIKPQ